jgi:molecular chaperone DnaJ
VVARTCGQCRGTGHIVPNPCQTCGGTGRSLKERRVTVKIPAGIADGQRLRLQGEGEHGAAGGPTGDLYVVVHVRPHTFFHREGDDLHVEVPVPFHMMALGGSFKLDSPAGALDVHVPPTSANGTIVAFRGKGVPSVTGRGRGAIYVRLVVDVPKKLTKEQKKIVEQLGAATSNDGIGPRALDSEGEKPFFEKVRDLFG